MEIYNNLGELLSDNVCKKPHELGKLFYKYIDCGPWTCFITEKGDEYYTDVDNSIIPKCLGIKLGSIVEGSDVEVRPHILMFPFPKAKLWETLDEINDEAQSLWDKANSDE